MSGRLHTAHVDNSLMRWIAKANSFQGHMRYTFVKKFAQAEKVGTNYVMVEIVTLTITTKKTGVNPGSLTSAAGVPAIQPRLDDFQSIPRVECFDTIKGLGKMQKVPRNSVRVKHVIEPVLHMSGQVEIEYAFHMFSVNQFLQTLKVL